MLIKQKQVFQVFVFFSQTSANLFPDWLIWAHCCPNAKVNSQ